MVLKNIVWVLQGFGNYFSFNNADVFAKSTPKEGFGENRGSLSFEKTSKVTESSC